MAEPSIKPGSDLIVKTYFPKAKKNSKSIFLLLKNNFFPGGQ